MKQRKQFTFYRSFLNAIEQHPREEWLGFLLAVIHYGLDKKVYEDLSPAQKSLFIMAMPVLDTAWEKAEMGSKGGKGRKASKLVSKKEKENEIENEIETETEGEGFVRFWGRYPKKLGRREAAAQWVRVRQKHSEDQIMEGLERWIRSASWAMEEGRFVPKAEKWLREEWFLQKPEPAVPMGASGELGQAEVEAIRRMFE